MSRHLKRLSMPKTWPLARKGTKFITKPSPGSHSLEYGLPLVIVLRDILKLATTSREAKKIVKHKTVIIDGRQIKDEKFPFGLFDRMYIPEIDKAYTVVLNKKGKLQIIEISKDKVDLKPLKVIGKRTVKKGLVQINCYDGKNILLKPDEAKNIKPHDSIVYDLKNKKIVKHLPLKQNADLVVIKGKHTWEFGKVKEITRKGNKRFVAIQTERGVIETPIEHVFVIEKNLIQ